jgi:hypothetical protein
MMLQPNDHMLTMKSVLVVLSSFLSIPMAVARYYAALSVIVPLLVVESAFSISPCAPPRFDVFAETLVRSWSTTTTTTPQDTTTTTTTTTTKAAAVEEVMRSCGGAVQGIREVPFVKMMAATATQAPGQSGGSSSIYLNRANDGFLFLDDGTYTCGPVVVMVDADYVERNESSDLFLFNFCVSENARLIVSSADWWRCTSTTASGSLFNQEEDDVDAVTGILLRKTFGGSGSDVVPVPTVDGSSIDPMSLRVNFSRSIQCSMPSFGQSWLLQRAKWEKQNDDKNVEEKHQLDNSTRMAGPLQYWAISQPMKDFCEWSGQSCPVTDTEHGGDAAIVLHAGVLCKSSGRVQAIARIYDIDPTAASNNKSLKSVSFLDGCLRLP